MSDTDLDPDIMAYLRRRMANAQTVAGNLPDSDPMHDLAKDRARQLQVVIDDLTAEQHHGSAAIEADLAAKTPGDAAAVKSFDSGGSNGARCD